MTTVEAAAKWGIAPKMVRKYCAGGRVPGAKKVKTERDKKPLWIIPDGTPKPKAMRGRRSPDLYNNKQDDDPVREIREYEMPCPDDIPPVLYVWQNQDKPIKRIADALGITSQRVTQLYDMALKLYDGWED